MRITGHKTPSVFKRYNITDDRDISAALDRVQQYIEALPTERKVEELETHQQENGRSRSEMTLVTLSKQFRTIQPKNLPDRET